MNLIDTWKQRNCDLVFTAQRMMSKPLSTCPNQKLPSSSGSSGSSSKKGKNEADSMPLISVMAATTTRKVSQPSTKNLALFTYLLPSLVRTLDCGFRYEFVLGFDKGDPYYDSDAGMKETKAWFKKHVEDVLKANGISCQLRLVKVNNTLKKPGPVFLEMGRAAFKAGSDYFYRINDDTELVARWPSKFVGSLKSIPHQLGVVGPVCNQGNQKILTHDFVARIHMQVFEMNYYPAELTDWWMDDWISLVYGQQRTFKARQVPVVHHTGAHGQRYEVDRTHEKMLGKLVESGRTKIRQWLLQNNVPEDELKAFDKDEFQPGYKFKDIPQHLREKKDNSQEKTITSSSPNP